MENDGGSENKLETTKKEQEDCGAVDKNQPGPSAGVGVGIGASSQTMVGFQR